MGAHVISPQTCLLASLNWLEKEMGVIVEQALIVRNSGTWLELRNLSSDGDLDADDFMPILRSLISRRVIADTDSLTILDVLLIDFHVLNPTPIVERIGLVTNVSTPSPWLSLAMVKTARGVEARDYSRVGEIWGSNMLWPF